MRYLISCVPAHTFPVITSS